MYAAPRLTDYSRLPSLTSSGTHQKKSLTSSLQPFWLSPTTMGKHIRDLLRRRNLSLLRGRWNSRAALLHAMEASSAMSNASSQTCTSHTSWVTLIFATHFPHGLYLVVHILCPLFPFLFEEENASFASPTI